MENINLKKFERNHNEMIKYDFEKNRFIDETVSNISPVRQEFIITNRNSPENYSNGKEDK